ncbi:ChaN family lipoprotein [Caldimonas tepidiphila]|uniref:ChaN family lipoprotein n=1 Tax=Caldimonas tepidiphila TaxID=2315841 RepID=UPI000E5AA5FF|nr:ChaN family lipoprotein [Caldimonas tepidiphila]
MKPDLRRLPRAAALAALPLLALAAAALPAAAQTAWLFGERHDQRDHQRQVAHAVRQLAAEGRLHAVVLEMAERGARTAGLPRDAGEAEVQAALRWSEAGWPWAAYRDVVMNAVAAGVPVHGGNLPRPVLRDAMREPKWDGAVPPEAHARLIDAVREGHCGMLPESQLAPMVRMQLARDRSLAETLAEAARGAGREGVVLMLSGSVHASRATGVPLQLPAVAPQLKVRSIAFGAAGAPDKAEQAAGFDELRAARQEPGEDPCAELRRRGMPGLAPAAPKEAPSPGATPPAVPPGRG